MAKVRRHRNKAKKKTLDNVRAQPGLDRKAHFANGGSLVEWMGGPRLVQRNKKKYRRPAPGSRSST